MTPSKTPSPAKEKTNASLPLPEVKTLPAWFNIENYEKAANLTLEEWGNELRTRLTLKETWYTYGNLIHPDKPDLPAKWKAIQQYGLISAWPDHPQCVLEEPVDLAALFPGITLPRPQPEPHHLKPLSSLRPITNDMMNFWGIFSDQEAIIRKFCLGHDYEKKLAADETERQEALRWLSRPIEFIRKFLMEDNAYLTINLAMTDEQIVADFKYWLAHQRRYDKRGHEVMFSAQKPEDWQITRDRIYLYLVDNHAIACAVKNLYDQICHFIISPDELLPPHYEAIKKILHAYAKAKKLPLLKEETRTAIFELASKMGYPTVREVPRKNPTQADFVNWTEVGVLPYWDLMFWAKMEGVRIRQRALGCGIFTQAGAGVGFDPPDRLRTTRKKTDYVVSHMMLTLLFEAIQNKYYE